MPSRSEVPGKSVLKNPENLAPFLDAIRAHIAQRVTLAYEDPLNRAGANLEDPGTIIAGPEAHGFSTPGGGWALFGRDGDVISYRFLFRRRGKQRWAWRRIDDGLIGFSSGWPA